MATIDNFSGAFEFLSNFYPIPVRFDGRVYPTVEHAFQAAKTFDLDEREAIRAASTPGKAKRLGRKATLRSDWNDVRISVMEALLRDKFSDSNLKEMLEMTNPFELIEGNNWNDKFWGVCNGEGQNHLGKLLMKIRNTNV